MNTVTLSWTPTMCRVLARAVHGRVQGRCVVYGAPEVRVARVLEAHALGALRRLSNQYLFVLSDAGSAAVRLAASEAEAEASRCLGNANEAREAGRGAAGWERKAQAWLDAANDLRGVGDVAETERVSREAARRGA